MSAGYFLNWQVNAEEMLTWTTSVNTSNKALSGRLVDCDGRVVDQFACKRSASSPDFLTWRTGLDWRQPAWGKWRLNASLDVQLASGALASGEQFSLGGVDTVRGYYDYEQSGDWGFQPTGVGHPPSGWKRQAFGPPRWRSSIAVCLLQNALPGQTASAQLGSAGFGLRVDVAKGLQLSADAARTFLKPADQWRAGSTSPRPSANGAPTSA